MREGGSIQVAFNERWSLFKYIEAFVALYGKEKVKVVPYELLKSYPSEYIGTICRIYDVSRLVVGANKKINRPQSYGSFFSKYLDIFKKRKKSIQFSLTVEDRIRNDLFEDNKKLNRYVDWDLADFGYFL